MDVVTVAAVSQIRADYAESPQVAYTPPTALAGSTYRTDLDITGAGVLHALQWYSSYYAKFACMRVTIDDNPPKIVGSASGITTSITYGIYTGALVLGDVRFKTRLKVEVYNVGSSAYDVGSTVTYSRT